LAAQDYSSAEISDVYFTDDALDIDELQEMIDTYRQNPLVWDNCRIKDLKALPLNDRLKSTLINLKQNRKKYSDWKQLATDANLAAAEVAAIRSFIVLSRSSVATGQILSALSLKSRDGETTLGKNLQRGRYHSRQNWFAGTVLESDADEPDVWDYRNFSLRSPKIHDRFELLGGAFRLNWGQGLLFASNLMSGRGTDVTGNLSSGRQGFKNYLGADENRYLFGVAGQFYLRPLNVYSFISHHKLDASVDENIVTNLRSDGIHISAAQIEAKDALSEMLGGFGLTYDWNGGTVGVLGYGAGYSLPIRVIENRQNIGGLTVFHGVENDGISISGEGAFLSNHGLGLIENIGLDLEKFAMSAGWRYFSPQFFAPLGSPFKKFSGMPNNESGFYTGLKVKLPRRWWWSGYVDFYREIESPVAGEMPQNGLELLTGANRQTASGNLIEAWYKHTKSYTAGANDRQLKLHIRQNYCPNLSLEIRAVAHWNAQTPISDGGQAIGFIGRGVLPDKTRLTMGITHYFVTASDLGIYFYEPGLPTQFNLNSLTGTGQRYFLIISRAIGSACEIAGAIRWRSIWSVSAEHSSNEFSGDLQLVFDL
ncbi:MAG: hypothetical protein V1681_02310, partial [Candidatus Neomarinimicrobiota bacterium]